MSATAIVKDIRTIRYIPSPGQHQLSINLGLADVATVFEFTRELNLRCEIVQIPTPKGVEIHALLLSKQAQSSPLGTSLLSEKLDELAEKINPDAIRHVYGRSKVA